VKFDVTTAEGQTAPATTEAGKAQIILSKRKTKGSRWLAMRTIRFGMDGAWVGANNGNSYFALTVDPGVHHLCASWQSSLGTFKKNIDLTSFTAEAGQVYYFAAAVAVGRDIVTFGLTPLNEDEGKFG